jgi:3-deoxy-7-phosphoheptulonate synthase
VAVGADGIMVEAHPDPRAALCDGPQSLDLEGLRNLIVELKPVAEAVGKRLA